MGQMVIDRAPSDTVEWTVRHTYGGVPMDSPKLQTVVDCTHCGEPAVPTADDWWLCEWGHEFQGRYHGTVVQQVDPSRC